MTDHSYHPSGYYTFPFETSGNYEYTPHFSDVQDNGYQSEMRTQLPPMSTFTTSAHLEADYTFTQTNHHEINLELLNSDNCLLAAVAAVAGDGNQMEEVGNTYHASNTSFTFASSFSQTSYIGNDLIFDGNSYMSPEEQHPSDTQAPIPAPTYNQMETYTNHSSSNHQTNYGLNHELSIMQPVNKCITTNSQNVVSSYDSQTGFTCLQSAAAPITTDIFSALGINDSDIPMTAETLIDTYACDVVAPTSLPATPVPNTYSYDGAHSQGGFLMQSTTLAPSRNVSTTTVSYNHTAESGPAPTLHNEKLPLPSVIQRPASQDDKMEPQGQKMVGMQRDVQSQTISEEAPLSKTVGTTTIERVPDESPMKILTNGMTNELSLNGRSERNHVVNGVNLIEEVKCFKCKLCTFISLEEVDVSQHIKEKHADTEPSKNMPNSDDGNKKSYVCSKCFKALSSLQECRQHMTSVHKLKLEKVWLQPVASNNKNEDSLKVKPILPSGKAPSGDVSPVKKAKPLSLSTTVNGPQCPAKKVALKKKSKREKGSFICEYKSCNIRFNLSSNLEFHYKCHKDSEPGFTCAHCQLSFEHWSSMAGHLWRKHSLDMELHKCEHCSYRTYSSSVLENIHKRIHSSERNFICEFCAKAFKNHKQLINHKVRHKTDQMKRSSEKAPENKVSHDCPICNRAFSDSRPLRVHMNMVHHKLRPFICSHCNHSAASRSALRTHLRSHTGEKPFKCEKCNYSTSDHNSLRRHKMRHSGERPYKCPFCTYACIQSSTYKQHLRNKHPGLCEGLMFMCSTCGFKTVNVDNYNTHISEHKVTSQQVASSTAATPESPTMQIVNGIIGTQKENN